MGGCDVCETKYKIVDGKGATTKQTTTN